MQSHNTELGFRHAFQPVFQDEQNFSKVLSQAYKRQFEVGETHPRILLNWVLKSRD